MNRQIINKLDKVLALADSDHGGEAVAAVRMARQMLLHDGLSFGDLARAAAQKPKSALSLGLFSGSQAVHEIELVSLRQRLDSLQGEIQMQSADLHYWRQRAENFEQQLTTAQDETRRWRQLARDTVEKLWDLSLAVQEIDREMAGQTPEKPE